jgi:curved DNA-binding protein CbpA
MGASVKKKLLHLLFLLVGVVTFTHTTLQYDPTTRKYFSTPLTLDINQQEYNELVVQCEELRHRIFKRYGWPTFTEHRQKAISDFEQQITPSSMSRFTGTMEYGGLRRSGLESPMRRKHDLESDLADYMRLLHNETDIEVTYSDDITLYLLSIGTPTSLRLLADLQSLGFNRILLGLLEVPEIKPQKQAYARKKCREAVEQARLQEELLKQQQYIIIPDAVARALNIPTSTSTYQVLGIQPGASETMIKQSYKELALKWLPDKNPNPIAPEVVEVLTNAYEQLLSTPSASIPLSLSRGREYQEHERYAEEERQGQREMHEEKKLIGEQESVRSAPAELLPLQNERNEQAQEAIKKHQAEIEPQEKNMLSMQQEEIENKCAQEEVAEKCEEKPIQELNHPRAHLVKLTQGVSNGCVRISFDQGVSRKFRDAFFKKLTELSPQIKNMKLFYRKNEFTIGINGNIAGDEFSKLLDHINSINIEPSKKEFDSAQPEQEAIKNPTEEVGKKAEEAQKQPEVTTENKLLTGYEQPSSELVQSVLLPALSKDEAGGTTQATNGGAQVTQLSGCHINATNIELSKKEFDSTKQEQEAIKNPREEVVKKAEELQKQPEVTIENRLLTEYEQPLSELVQSVPLLALSKDEAGGIAQAISGGAQGNQLTMAFCLPCCPRLFSLESKN